MRNLPNLSQIAVLAILALPGAARAAWPTDLQISGMDKVGDVAYDDGIPEAFTQLCRELGVVVANDNLLPASTTGAAGWDLAISNRFTGIQGHAKDGEDPTGWERADADGRPDSPVYSPALTLRKGLPLSTEVGLTASWIGGSYQGTFGGFARVALLENFRPAPDLTVQVGYSGLVGNPELGLGVLDLGLKVGTRLPLSRQNGVTFSHWAPFAEVTALHVSAVPHIGDRATELGLEKQNLWLMRYGGGFQVTNNSILLRLGGAWVPRSAPTFGVALGVAL